MAHTLPKSKFIRKAEIEAVLKRLSRGPTASRDRLLVLLAAGLGLRVTEAVCMTLAAFRELGEGWVYVRSAKKRQKAPVRCSQPEAEARRAAGIRNWRTKTVGYPTDRRPEERLPVPPAIIPEIRAYLKGRQRGYLFPGRDGEGHMSERQAFNIFSDACKACGLGHKSFHALRHYRGFTLQAAKHDLSWTSRMLRHENVQTTLIYTQRTPDEEQKLAKEVGW